MTGAAILQLIGGVRAAVWAVLLLVALALLGMKSCTLADTRVTLSDERAAWAKQSLAQATEVIAAQQRVNAAERKYSKDSADARSAYEKGLADGQAKEKSVAAAVRTGDLKLRPQWAGCATQRLSESVAAAAGSSPDDAADLRAADSGSLVRVGSDANAGTLRLQSELIATRALCGALN
jgi:hypothetical protein